MSGLNNSVEGEGAKARDHTHFRHRLWKHARRSWVVGIALVLMLAAIVVYVMSDNLSLRPGKSPIAPTPEANAP